MIMYTTFISSRLIIKLEPTETIIPRILGVFCLSGSDIPITMIISLTRVFVSADKTIVPPPESEVQHRHQETRPEARVPRRARGRHSGQGE